MWIGRGDASLDEKKGKRPMRFVLTAGFPGVRRRNDSRQSHLVHCIAGRVCLHLLNCPPSAYAINLPLIHASVNMKGPALEYFFGWDCGRGATNSEGYFRLAQSVRNHAPFLSEEIAGLMRGSGDAVSCVGIEP